MSGGMSMLRWTIGVVALLTVASCERNDATRGGAMDQITEAVRLSRENGHGIFVFSVSEPYEIQGNFGGHGSRVTPQDVKVLAPQREGSQFGLGVGGSALVLYPKRNAGDKVILIHMGANGNNLIWTAGLEEQIHDLLARESGHAPNDGPRMVP